MLAVKTSTIQFRVEPELKEKAMKVLRKNNLDMSFVLQTFIRQIVDNKKAPEKLLTINGLLPEVENRILKNFKNAKWSKSHTTVESFMADLNS
jgi:addiction module RelB/DinJ family antitoxin